MKFVSNAALFILPGCAGALHVDSVQEEVPDEDRMGCHGSCTAGYSVQLDPSQPAYQMCCVADWNRPDAQARGANGGCSYITSTTSGDFVGLNPTYASQIQLNMAVTCCGTAFGSDPSGGPCSGISIGAAAVGDPHLQNVHGERFDLMKPGKHVLINIPKGVVVENALFRVEAKASQLGGQCADMYFQEINITGRWVETKLAGGLRFQAPGVADESPNWMTFGKVEVKVAHGHTRQGIQYLNLYVKHLGHAGFAVGGLLGEDDHKDVMIPPASCTHRTSLLGEQTEGLTSASVSSVAMAIPERLDELTMQDGGSCECACGTPPDCTFDKTSCPDCK